MTGKIPLVFSLYQREKGYPSPSSSPSVGRGDAKRKNPLNLSFGFAPAYAEASVGRQDRVFTKGEIKWISAPV
jgi:hypothetical protein